MLSSFKYAAIVLLLLCPACAYAETTVALTTTVHADATPEEKKLAGNLLALLEVETNQYPAIQVVERQQLDLALLELVLSSSRNAEATLQLGNLAKADLILTAKILKPDEAGQQQVLVRITQAATAVIQGVTAVPISPVQIEEAAAEITGYLATTAKGPKSQLPTIAVLPFESVERFDRLRPLERGLRDLFVLALMQHKTCRVVQRSSMEQLLSELDLVRSGLTAGVRGLEDAPAREATYILRGEIDERTSPEGNLVVIVIELIDVKSRQVVSKIERSCKQKDLAEKVTEIAEVISQSISKSKDALPPSKNAGIQEIDRLYEMALRDVWRFIRRAPFDSRYYPLHIPGIRKPPGLHSKVDPDSPLGAHLLKKTVDRLESILFIDPDRLTAAFPLAYCLSFHVEGIWQPKRCEQLLRRIREDSTDVEMQKVANRLLGDMYFTHKGCLYSSHEMARVDPELLKLGFDCQLDAFVNTPRAARWWPWVSMLRPLRSICDHTQDESQWLELLEVVSKVVKEPVSPKKRLWSRNALADEASQIAAAAIRGKVASAKVQAYAEELLQRWHHSDNFWLQIHSSRQLIRLSRNGSSDHEFDAMLDEVFESDPDLYVKQFLKNQKIWLAQRHLARGDAEAALRMLKNFPPKSIGTRGYDTIYNQYGYLLGRCYEELGRKQEALEAYLHYAEISVGFGHVEDFSARIEALGGVPLKGNRDVNVRYPEPTQGTPIYCKVLATDNKQLFCSGGFQQGRRGPKAIGIQSVQALHLKTQEWTHLGGPDDRVSCLAVAEGYLWAGTDHQGLWRMTLANNQWRQWTTDDGLPTNSIISVEAHGPIAYAGVGNIDPSHRVISGGVVRIDPAVKSPTDEVHIYRGKAAPQTAPAGMAIHENQLVVNGLNTQFRRLDLPTDEWQKLQGKFSQVVDAGHSGFWYQPREQIASLLDLNKLANKATSKSYPAAPLLKDYPAGQYSPKFFVEHDGQLWIGGYPWRKFGDTGLFRLDLAAGTLTSYGPRDGFRHADQNRYECYDGVWAKDRLWVATSFGLAEVAMRDPTERDSKTLVRRAASDAPMRKIRDVSGQGRENSVKTNSVKMQPKIKALGPVDRLDDQGFSQLHRAASAGNVKFAQSLIDRGVNVDIPQHTFHGTPLQYAASAGQARMVELLLKHKATVDATDTRGRTPLMWAASEGHPEAAHLLIQAGADINKTTGGGWTPLHYAAQKGHFEVAQLLMKHGANLSKKNSNGKTPLDLNPNIAPPQ